MRSGNSGVGATGILGVAFVVLKLTGVINWSWWWVTLPFWGVLALFVVIILVAYVVLYVRAAWK
jgi:hypothetical protein